MRFCWNCAIPRLVVSGVAEVHAANCERVAVIMGGSQSVEVPGGGSEGYHILKVYTGMRYRATIAYAVSAVAGTGQFPGAEGRNGALLRLPCFHRRSEIGGYMKRMP